MRFPLDPSAPDSRRRTRPPTTLTDQKGIFSLVNDLLLVLIIMEVLRTVGRFLRKREPNVDVEDLVPFLVIG